MRSGSVIAVDTVTGGVERSKINLARSLVVRSSGRRRRLVLVPIRARSGLLARIASLKSN